MNITLLDYHLDIQDEEIILYYKGPFQDQDLDQLGNHLRSNFNGPPKVAKRLFAIFIELAQNIGFYSVEMNHFKGKNIQERGVGVVIVYRQEDRYTLSAGNLIRSEKLANIVSKCEKINTLDQEGLRTLKKEMRSQPRKEDHNGGNIGLIQVALKADFPLKIHQKPIDDELSFFILSAEIERDITLEEPKEQEETSETPDNGESIKPVENE